MNTDLCYLCSIYNALAYIDPKQSIMMELDCLLFVELAHLYIGK